MSNLQKTLDALQPYVIGIRYLDGMPVVDAVFKEDWTLPESNLINKVKGNNDVNYYMIFSEADGIGLDELLEYVDTVIKINIEKEKKHELLKKKVNELKELFKRTSLVKLQQLKFSFLEDDLMPELNDLNVNEEKEEKTFSEQPADTFENTEKTIDNQDILTSNHDEPLTEEEREILEEEKRLENFKRYQENKKANQQLNNIKNKVELPPKKTIQSELLEIDDSCECAPDEACSKCIDKKSL